MTEQTNTSDQHAHAAQQDPPGVRAGSASRTDGDDPPTKNFHDFRLAHAGLLERAVVPYDSKEPWMMWQNENHSQFAHFREWMMLSEPRPTLMQFHRGLLQRKKLGELPNIQKVVSWRTLYNWYREFDWDSRCRALAEHLLRAEVEGRANARRVVGSNTELESYRERIVSAVETLHGLGTALAGLTHMHIDKSKKSKLDKLEPGIAAMSRAASSAIKDALDIEAALVGLEDVIGTLARSESEYEG